MSIDLHQCDWASSLKCTEDRYWYAVVAAQDDGQGAGGKYLANGQLGPAAMRREVGEVSQYVATINDLDRPSVQERASNIEIPPVKSAQRALAIPADMGWSVGLIVRDLINGVGGAVWNTDNRDVCIERVQIKTNRKIVKALKLTSGDGGERLCHAVLLMRSGVVELDDGLSTFIFAISGEASLRRLKGRA
jgi:hypothetical protein